MQVPGNVEQWGFMESAWILRISNILNIPKNTEVPTVKYKFTFGRYRQIFCTKWPNDSKLQYLLYETGTPSRTKLSSTIHNLHRPHWFSNKCTEWRLSVQSQRTKLSCVLLPDQQLLSYIGSAFQQMHKKTSRCSNVMEARVLMDCHLIPSLSLKALFFQGFAQKLKHFLHTMYHSP